MTILTLNKQREFMLSGQLFFLRVINQSCMDFININFTNVGVCCAQNLVIVLLTEEVIFCFMGLNVTWLCYFAGNWGDYRFKGSSPWGYCHRRGMNDITFFLGLKILIVVKVSKFQPVQKHIIFTLFIHMALHLVNCLKTHEVFPFLDLVRIKCP